MKDAAEWFGEELAKKHEQEFSDFLISEGASGNRLKHAWKYQISIKCIGMSDRYSASGEPIEIKRAKKISIEIRERTEQVPNEYFKVNFAEKGTGKRKVRKSLRISMVRAPLLSAF